jgi:hypothetical protein
MLVQVKAFYLFLLLMGSHGEVILGSSVDAEGPDLDGASTVYSRPSGQPNLFGASLQNGQRGGLVDDGDGDGGPRGNDLVPRRMVVQMRRGRGGGDVHATASTSTSNDLKKNTVRGGLGTKVCAYYMIECIFAVITSWQIKTDDSVLSFARDRRPLLMLMLIPSSSFVELTWKVAAVSFLLARFRSTFVAAMNSRSWWALQPPAPVLRIAISKEDVSESLLAQVSRDTLKSPALLPTSIAKRNVPRTD